MTTTIHFAEIPANRSHGLHHVAVAASGLIAIGLLGYGVFLLFVRGGSTVALWGAFAVAAIAGVASFFSPCSFPLLPGYLGYYALSAQGPRRRSFLMSGLAAAAGVAVFGFLLAAVLGLVGLGVAPSFSLVGPAPSGTTRILRFAVGAIWLGLAAIQLADVSFHGLLDRLRPLLARPARSLFAYGFGYTVAGIGCTAPFLASVAVLALASGGPLEALGAVAVFVLTMAALMLAVSWATARSAPRLKALATATPRIKKAGGVLLAIVGASTIVLTAWPQLLLPLFP